MAHRSGSGEPEGGPSIAEERDQAADRRDQAAERRDRAADQRDRTADRRDQASDRRDQAGGRRDRGGEQRDQAAAQRDEAAEQVEALVGDGPTTDALSLSALARREGASDRGRASQDRKAGASERDQAELDRDNALADRGAAASQRDQAEVDRNAAVADRRVSARARKDSSFDDLTGVYIRGAGFVELEREIARARRAEEPLVLAFVDVDGLKALNDSRGHADGDRMLLRVANSLKAQLRSHDLIIRYGGDEFVCAISGLNMADAKERLAIVDAALAEVPEHGSVTVGLAELQPGDSPEDLVARADAALYREREQQRGSQSTTYAPKFERGPRASVS